MSRQETTTDFGINWPKSHKRGPYTKSDKESRRNEVSAFFRICFRCSTVCFEM